MDFDSVADELYAGPREEFTTTRNTRAGEAKAAGDRELANEIKGLRKPSIAAWLVNRLTRERPEELGDLAELGERLRAAHSDLAGERLRTLSGERRDALRALSEQARQIGRAAGYAAGDNVVDEVWATLEATLGDPELAREVSQGRLHSALSTAGAETWLTAGTAQPLDWAVPPKRAERSAGADNKAKAERGGRTRTKAAEDKRAESERRRATELQRERLEHARRQAAVTTEARGKAKRELDEAKREAERAEESVRALRAQLDAAERRAKRTLKAVSKAQQDFDSANRAAESAKRQLERARPDRDEER